MPREIRPPDADNLDGIEVSNEALPFQLVVRDFDDGNLSDLIDDADIVVGGGYHKLHKLSAYCAMQGVPYVHVSEYTLRTRCQIVRASEKNPVIAFRRLLWEAQEELKTRKSIKQAAGVQCNGTPTYNIYSKINGNALLYFDNRTRSALMQTEDELNRKFESLSAGRPIRLAFSGRLAPIKGADDLITIGAQLLNLGVDFTLDIFGDGPSRASMEEKIEAQGLSSLIRMHGSVDFESELLPFVKSQIDLFVCPHRQGDPSCTYFETFACGVPIAGYENEAFSGILSRYDVGWGSALNDPVRLAKLIREISRDSGAMASKAQRALSIAKQHSFEHVWQQRIDHLLATLEAAGK